MGDDEPRFGISSAERSLETNSRLRNRAREDTVRDTFGEEVLLSGPKTPPPHLKAYAKEFKAGTKEELEEARAFVSELENVARVVFVQMVRQPNYEVFPILVRWGVGVPDAPALYRPAPEAPITRQKAVERIYLSKNYNSPLYHTPLKLPDCVNLPVGGITVLVNGTDREFKRGQSLPAKGPLSWDNAKKYFDDNKSRYLWMRIRRVGEEYFVERKNVRGIAAKSHELLKAKAERTGRTCTACGLPMSECAGHPWNQNKEKRDEETANAALIHSKKKRKARYRSPSF